MGGCMGVVWVSVDPIVAWVGMPPSTACLTHKTTKQYIINITAFDDLVKRKMFVVSAFEIHGGVGGLFDLGPPSCALKVHW